MPARRPLDFQSLDEVILDVERLHTGGYESAGAWNLAQCAGHVSEWMRYPMDGYPAMNPAMRFVMWGLRNTVGTSQKRKVLATRGFPAGGPTVRESVPEAGGDEGAAVDTLRATVARMKAFEGTPIPSPLFGPLTRDEWLQLSLTHCAHHLSFLLPKSS